MSKRKHKPGESRPRAKANAKMRANRARLRRQALRRLAKAYRKTHPGPLGDRVAQKWRTVWTGSRETQRRMSASDHFSAVLNMIKSRYDDWASPQPDETIESVTFEMVAQFLNDPINTQFEP